ncbi:K(+)-transporting ATPase subunit C [Anaerorhabdus furcosa]|uniref:Potassium-transporting ATPase KdpC subunit n=1 Tax=Anaerorhabdus furcosa TaxID=118967 RepID=A0A1T4LGX6_9FIRM|nr:K(+)-transporting ATPase subunit C [Anaerorhabdus furcosa]SJZ53827.1 K+-transporting ATPase ATPase C chain [Anaerorhabdus furcosa]
MKEFFKGFKKAILLTLSFLVICGLIFPIVLTGVSQLIFPKQANGSLIEVNGEVVGSELIGQDFSEDYFLKCRPSAVNYNTYTQEQKDNGDYSGVASGSTNYAPTNPNLTDRVAQDIEDFLQANPTVSKEEIPTDLLTASGSGLDPHISVASAKIQLEAVSKASGLSMDVLNNIVDKNTSGKVLGIFGEETVNVLKANLDIAKEMGLLNN